MLSAKGKDRARWEVDTELNFGLVDPRWSGISQVGKYRGKLEMWDSELIRQVGNKGLDSVVSANRG